MPILGGSITMNSPERGQTSTIAPEQIERAATDRVEGQTYRVQGIPQHHTWKSAKAFLEACLGFGNGSSDIKLHSLAHSAIYKGEKTATITSADLSRKLGSEKEEWTFDLLDDTDLLNHGGPKNRLVAIDNHFEGFTALNSFDDEKDHLLDCIALPGLGGHAFGSFKQRQANHMWLRDALPRDLHGARVLVYGYDTQIAKSESFQDLEAWASTFRRALVSVRRQQIKPLIFVAHSLGGLVLKAAIIQMSSETPMKAESSLKAICGVLFFGCPNQGIDVKYLIPMCNGQANLSFLSSLSSNQSAGPLRQLSHNFAKTFVFSCSRIISFYETQFSFTAIKGSNGLWTTTGSLAVLVNEISATHGRPGGDEAHNVQAIHRDHSHMIKFSPNDTNYYLVLGFLKEVAASAGDVSACDDVSAGDVIKARDPDDIGMMSINTTNNFSGHSNRGFQLGSNSGHVLVNIHSQPDLPQPDVSQQQRWLEKLSNASQAAFNSSERQHDPICLVNTRVDVLNEIRAWADGQDERRLYWLNGLAGTGKSTIARTIAREYFEHGRLGASFFFTKGGGDVGHARKFFTTIAFQLAKMSPSLKSNICSAISENNDIMNQSLRDQWNQLIIQPMSKLDRRPLSYILVIDALDECEGESDIRAILQLLAEARSLRTVQLRIFLTSRPEVPIRLGFYQISDAEHQDFVLHNISPPIIDHDIRIFLEYNLKFISQERSLDAGWPDEQIIKRLIQRASGLFIWAATACRFIHEGKQFAAKRLDMIFEDNIDSTAPEKHLNEIYITVLKQSINCSFTEEEKKTSYGMLRQVLGSIVVLFSPFSANSLGRLLHITEKGIVQTLEDLHAILDIPKDQTRPLRLHHPSFRDFLINKERCGDPNFWIDEKHAHQTLAENSIRLMTKSLTHDICHLQDYGVLVTDIYSSRVQQYLPQEVQYACLYWVQHLQKSGATLFDDDQAHQFLRAHVLHWLEALSWMRKLSEGIHAIISLESIALSSDCPGFYAFIHDIKRFALYCRPGIGQAPLQVYCSALVFAPTMSLVRKQFESRIPGWIKRLPEVENDWNAALQTLEGHSDSVNAVGFSPDGKMLASASDDATVKLWDAGTGAALQTLKGHSNRVNALAFSPDGKIMASASSDATVELWDAGTGAALQTLKGHSGYVNALAFSPDGKVLASASGDTTVKMWDAVKGAALQTIEGSSGPINAVAYSPDGKVLVSASGWAVKLWNVGTGKLLQTLDGNSHYVNFVAFVAFSPNGKVLVLASNNATIKLWDAGTGAALRTLKGHSSQVRAVAFSPGGRVLASASNDATVKMWDADTGAVLGTLEGHLSRVRAIAFSPDGKALASASEDQTVKLWDADTRAAPQTLEDNSRHSTYITAVAFSTDGKVLASVSGDVMVKLWDAGTGVALLSLHGFSIYCLSAVAFSPDGKVLASTLADGTIMLWDACTGAALQRLYGHSAWVNAVTFSPDGKMLASGSDDETVKLWDAGTGATLWTLHHRGQVKAVAFSPDSKVLASGSTDATVMLWDTTERAALQTISHLGRISALAFSPDSTVLVSASDNEEVKLWDAGTGAALQKITALAIIRTVSFADDGKLLETDQGILRATSSSVGGVSFPRMFPGGISVKHNWITQRTANLIWLPSEYRPSCTAVHGSTIALGHKSGRLSIFELYNT